jgi:hypothetical protein
VEFQSFIFGQILANLGSFGQFWAEFAAFTVAESMPELGLKSSKPHNFSTVSPNVTCNQGCHNGRFWMKITVRTSGRVRIYPADAILPTDGFLPSADAVKIASAWTQLASARTPPNIRADVSSIHTDTFDPPPRLPSLPPPLRTQSTVRADADADA